MGNYPKTRREKLAVELARDMYVNDQLEIDPDAVVSNAEPSDRNEDADGGIWVSAWVWVPSEEISAAS